MKYYKYNDISSTASLVVAKSLGEQFVERSDKVMVTLFAKLAKYYIFGLHIAQDLFTEYIVIGTQAFGI